MLVLYLLLACGCRKHTRYCVTKSECIHFSYQQGSRTTKLRCNDTLLLFMAYYQNKIINQVKNYTLNFFAPIRLRTFTHKLTSYISFFFYLWRVVALLTEVLDELHQAVNHQLHSQHHALQIVP